jgi:hypothetical protein
MFSVIVIECYAHSAVKYTNGLIERLTVEVVAGDGNYESTFEEFWY